MDLVVFRLLAAFDSYNIAQLRLAGLLTVLVVGLFSGYLASNRFGVSEHLAKMLMTLLMVSFNWMIALLVIWQMQLSPQLTWLPVIGLVLMLSTTALSIVIFSLLKVDSKSRLTLILAGGLSNTGYTGGAFVCYAVFGTVGLALANIYHVFSLPTFYFIYLPLLKFRQLRSEQNGSGFTLSNLLDPRMLTIPAIIVALSLNLTGVKVPSLLLRIHLVDIFVYTASLLAFFSIGLRIKFSRLKNYVSLYFVLSVVKFILTPVMALLIIWFLSLTGHDLSAAVKGVIIVLSTAPSAVIMVTMSNVFDLDAPLASALWVVTTAIFVVIIVPVLYFVFA